MIYKQCVLYRFIIYKTGCPRRKLHDWAENKKKARNNKKYINTLVHKKLARTEELTVPTVFSEVFVYLSD